MEYENFDRVLVKLVRRNSNIYDRSHAHFKNKAARENTWTSISRALNRSKDECLQRWNGLRNRYAMERRKGRIDGKLPTWPLYETMTFLDKFMLARTSYGCYKSRDAATEYTNHEKPEGIDLDESFIVDEIEESNSETHQRGDNAISPMSESYKEYYYSPMDKMIDPVHIKEEPLDSPMHGMMRLKPKPDATLDMTNVEDAFGTTVALMLKNIRGHKKRRKAQLEIMQVLCNYSSGSDTE